MSKPIRAADGPFTFKAEKDKTYYWCACGRSKNQPLCDGSHVLFGFTPISFALDESRTVFLCGCKQSGNKPYCDGSHNK